MRAALLALLIAATTASELTGGAARAAVPDAQSQTSERPNASASTQAQDAIATSTATLRQALVGNPAGLQAFASEDIMRLLVAAGRDPSVSHERDELIEVLYLGRWNPEPGKLDGIWLELALKRLAEGRTTEAAEVAQLIDSPSLLISMRVEKRFDPITQQNERHFDPLAGGERQLAALEHYRAAHPESLQTLNRTAHLLLQLGRNTQALVLLDQAIKDANPADKAPSRFNDLSDLNWTLQYRATALDQLGRKTEAEAQLRDAAKKSERGHSNVSQKLNAAGAANWAGRPKDALKLLRGAGGSISGYGLTVQQAELVCAYAQLNDERRMRAALQALARDASAGLRNLFTAQLCASDFEGARATLKQQLADPSARNGFLVRLQTFRPGGDTVRLNPAAASDFPFENEWLRRRDELLALPDVVAAIDAVGRVETFPVRGS